LTSDRQEAKLQSSSPIPAATQSERKRRHPQKVRTTRPNRKSC